MKNRNPRGRRLLAVTALIFVSFLLLAPPVMASSEGGHGEAAPSAGWRATDTYRVLNFLVLAGVLFFAVRKPAKAALAGRIEDIKKELADLEERKQAAQAEMKAYEERLSKMDAEARTIVEDYVAQGEAAKARILDEAGKAAERLKEQAKRHMDHEFDEARRALKEEILNRAVALSEEKIRTGINDEDQNRLVGEYLEKVVAQ
ncbi:MAG: ATP synthase F0 subunit B [Proteobacteria bacterium]|nr:ATP synthase F0 subunit B [Pseudomonadota bacterium]